MSYETSRRKATLSALTRGTIKMCGSAIRAPFDRPTRVSFLEAARVYHHVYLHNPALPVIAPTEVIPDEKPIRIMRYLRGKWELSLQELSIIVGLALSRGVKHVFEIGTFDGRTSLNLHLNVPDATIHTIDLPAGHSHAPDGKSPGGLIREFAAAGAIKQLWGDSLQFDFSPWHGRQDLVFVDAGHSYRNALADSRTALRMVEGREGAVLWHDYCSWPGVTQAVDEVCREIASEVTMGWIEGTALAVMVARPGHPIRLISTTAHASAR